MASSLKRHIGRILLDGGFLSQKVLDSALNEQKYTKELLGEVLVRMGTLKAEDVAAPLLIQKHLGNIDDAVKMAAGERQLLGALLVQSGHVSNEQLFSVIDEQKRTGERLGEVFIRLGILTERQLKALLDFQTNQEAAHVSPLRLGDMLLATGHITCEQLQSALARQASSHKKLGEVLVEAGYATPNHVSYGVRLQKMLLSAVLAAIISLGVSAPSSAESSPEPVIKTLVSKVLNESGEFSRLSEKEMELFRLINRYRESQGLPAIENSRSLNKVARIHAIDLAENSPAQGQDSRGLDCSLHSWSDKGTWKQVCYTKDHVYAEGMWDKPREITNFTYSGDGFENAYSTGEQEVTPAKVLEAWKASPSHNAVLVESGVWKGGNHLAFGVGIYKNHAVMWVGAMVDPLGPMQTNIALAKN
ncbi:MAG TPA: hypothetical protein HPP97_04335 [Desulfuromonadales bacterium]|nr:hypothetical protein [Desulfuromonadales bacterium]